MLIISWDKHKCDVDMTYILAYIINMIFSSVKFPEAKNVYYHSGTSYLENKRFQNM